MKNIRTSVSEYMNYCRHNKFSANTSVNLGENDKVNIPVSFTHIINNIQGQLSINESSYIDITPFEALEIIDAGYDTITKIYYVQPTDLFKTMYYWRNG